MIYTEQTKKAMKLCFEAHKDQLDRAGMPYPFHPFHLAEQMEDEFSTAAALLHDVVEDTAYTLEDLAEMGFAPEIIHALGLLTHDKKEPYMEYVCRAGCCPISRAVKLADLRHNSDLSRLDNPDAADERRALKYTTAVRLLESLAPTSENPEIYRAGIFLDPEKTLFLSMTVTESRVLEYCLDADRNLHFLFSPEVALRLFDIFAERYTFPQQLMRYFQTHTLSDFIRLTEKEGLAVQKIGA